MPLRYVGRPVAREPVRGLPDGPRDRAGPDRARRADSRRSAAAAWPAEPPSACLARRGPCVRACAVIQRRCCGGRRRHTSQAVSAMPTGPTAFVREVRGIAALCRVRHHLVRGESPLPVVASHPPRRRLEAVAAARGGAAGPTGRCPPGSAAADGLVTSVRPGLTLVGSAVGGGGGCSAGVVGWPQAERAPGPAGAGAGAGVGVGAGAGAGVGRGRGRGCRGGRRGGWGASSWAGGRAGVVGWLTGRGGRLRLRRGGLRQDGRRGLVHRLDVGDRAPGAASAAAPCAPVVPGLTAAPPRPPPARGPGSSMRRAAHGGRCRARGRVSAAPRDRRRR